MGTSRHTYTRTLVLRSICTYFCLLPGVWTQTPILNLGDWTNGNCTVHSQDQVTLEGSVDLTGVAADDWSNLVEFVFQNGDGFSKSFVLCQADLSNCMSQSQLGCYCRERNGALYTIAFNQTADVQYSRMIVRTRLTALDSVTDITSVDKIYPTISDDINILLLYGNDSQRPAINNSVVDLPDDNLMLTFSADGMRNPSSINVKLSSPDLSMVFVNRTSVNITVYDSTNYIKISYQEDLYCERGATYQFTLKAVTRPEPILRLSSLTAHRSCPLAGEDMITIEAEVDFTGVDYSEWILDVRFFTAQNLTLCVVPLLKCEETPRTTCYCKGHQGDVYTIVFNDTANPDLSLQMIKLGASRTNSSTIEAAETIEYPFVDDGINVTMVYGNETQSPPINDSMIYIPDDNQVIQFTVRGMRSPSLIRYHLNSPDFERTFEENQNSVSITVYDSTNYITIWYEEDDSCQRSATAAYHFTLKAVTRQDPTLSLGPITSSTECVLSGESMVTFEAEVDFTGVDYSQWILYLRYYTPPVSNFMLCGLSIAYCGETSRISCYCKSHVRDVYTFVFNDTADLTHSSQPIYLEATRTNFSTLTANETTVYPFVNEPIYVIMTYDNQTLSPPIINNSQIYVPDDNQELRFTIYGLRHPSSIGYRLSSPDHGSEFENQSSINITVYDSTNYIYIWYEEKDFCQRSGTYTFVLKAVELPDPTLHIGPFTSSDQCVVSGESMVTSEAVVDFTGVDYSQWNLTVLFFTGTDNSILCAVSLLECMDEHTTRCYCKGHIRDEYTIVFNDTADLALSLQPVLLGMTMTNLSSIETAETQEYPLVNQDITISMTYGNETRSPPINNSMIYIPDDSPVIQFTIDGLPNPSSIRYELSDEDSGQDFVNQSSISITVSNSTNYMTILYEEKDFCQRSATYHFPVKVVSKEEPALRFTSPTGNHSCLLHGEDRVTIEAIVDFTGVDDSKWIPIVSFFTPSHSLFCSASLMDCSELHNGPCYCKGRSGYIYTVVLNHTADAASSLQPIHLSVNKTDFSQLEANETQEYPFVSSEKIEVNVSTGNQTRSPPFGIMKLFIPIDDQEVQFSVAGLSQPYSISYITSAMSHEAHFSNQSSVVISLNESTTFLNVSYGEDMYCKRTNAYHFTLKVVWRDDPQVVSGAFQSSDVSCPISGKHFVTLEQAVNFTGVDDSQWLQSVDFVTPTSNGSNKVICNASLVECRPTSAKMCYCKDHTEEIYTVVFNHKADLSLSGNPIRLVTYREDASSTQFSEALNYPFISDDIGVNFRYAHQGPRPFINNSVQEISDDHSSVTVIVTGLNLPFTVRYVTSAKPDDVTSVVNQSTVIIPVSETRITVTYEERQRCRRSNSYILTMEDDSSDGLSTGAIVGIVFGSLLIFVLIIALITLAFNKNCWCKTKKRYTYATAERAAVESNSTRL